MTDQTPPPELPDEAKEFLKPPSGGKTAAEAAEDAAPEAREGEPAEEPEPVFDMPEKDKQAMLPTPPPADLYIPPDLPVSDEDLKNFLDSIVSGDFYSESFKKGPVEVSFRVKTGKEVNYISAIVAALGLKGRISSRALYLHAISILNVSFQTTDFCGRENAAPAVPQAPWDVDALVEAFDKIMGGGIAGAMKEHGIFIVSGLLSQFDKKVNSMMRRVLSPSFTEPERRG